MFNESQEFRLNSTRAEIQQVIDSSGGMLKDVILDGLPTPLPEYSRWANGFFKDTSYEGSEMGHGIKLSSPRCQSSWEKNPMVVLLQDGIFRVYGEDKVISRKEVSPIEYFKYWSVPDNRLYSQIEQAEPIIQNVGSTVRQLLLAGLENSLPSLPWFNNLGSNYDASWFENLRKFKGLPLNAVWKILALEHTIVALQSDGIYNLTYKIPNQARNEEDRKHPRWRKRQEVEPIDYIKYAAIAVSDIEVHSNFWRQQMEHRIESEGLGFSDNKIADCPIDANDEQPKRPFTFKYKRGLIYNTKATENHKVTLEASTPSEAAELALKLIAEVDANFLSSVWMTLGGSYKINVADEGMKPLWLDPFGLAPSRIGQPSLEEENNMMLKALTTPQVEEWDNLV